MRLRTKLRQLLPKPKVSAKEWEQIQSDATAAKELIEDERFAFLRDYLQNSQASIVDHFVNNRIKPTEQHTFFQDFALVKHITKKEQEQELTGKYAFVEQLLSDLQVIADLPAKTLHAQERGEVEIERSSEEE